jgi:hypothetical protein
MNISEIVQKATNNFIMELHETWKALPEEERYKMIIDFLDNLNKLILGSIGKSVDVRNNSSTKPLNVDKGVISTDSKIESKNIKELYKIMKIHIEHGEPKDALERLNKFIKDNYILVNFKGSCCPMLVKIDKSKDPFEIEYIGPDDPIRTLGELGDIKKREISDEKMEKGIDEERLCNDCGDKEGIWIIYIHKLYWGSFGKKDKYLCDDCLILAIEGAHTGGGLRSDAIKKIKKTRKERKEITKYWDDKHKEQKKNEKERKRFKKQLKKMRSKS